MATFRKVTSINAKNCTRWINFDLVVEIAHPLDEETGKYGARLYFNDADGFMDVVESVEDILKRLQ